MNEYVYEVMPLPYEGAQQMIKRTDIEGNVAWVPADEANSDYQAYLKQLAETK